MSSTLVALLTGAALGFVLSIPAAGPLLGLVVLAGARGDFRRGLALASGGALAESLWALAALWGVDQLLARQASLLPAMRIASALLLVAIGVVLWRRASPGTPEPQARQRALAPALLGFSLVLVNPGFPLTWAAVIAALYSSGVPEVIALPFALGVFAGIVVWFALVLAVARRLGSGLDARRLAKATRVVAALLFAVAAWLLVSLLL